ncbi:MAG: hypothetical protein HXY40_15340, partial [Chloroflexi bacterium]|nr:hypothetical protein [Chloroflexota bacterium]
RRVVGARPQPFYPTGDIQKDMQVFREFYRQFTPAVPENFGPVRVRPHETGEWLAAKTRSDDDTP